MACDIAIIFQILAIIGGIFAIIVGVFWFMNADFFRGVNGFFNIVFGCLIILTELWRPAFFRYFGFLVLFWGKSFMFAILFLRTFITPFKNNEVQFFGWIIDIILVITFLIFAIIFGGGTIPLLQRSTNGPEMGTSSNDLFRSNVADKE